MKSPLSLLALLAILSSTISNSVLSTTDIATVLASAHDQQPLTVPPLTTPALTIPPPTVLGLTVIAPALAAIKKLDMGGATANSLTARDKRAINDMRDDYVTTARAGNTVSKAGLGGGTGTARNIAFLAAKTTLRACETAQQQIALAGGSASVSDTTVNLLISNAGLLNTNAKAAEFSNKRVEFVA